MAQIKSSRWWIGLTGILATVFLASAATLTIVGWPHVSMPAPEPSASYHPAPSVTPTSEAIVHPVALEAWPLTDPVLQSIGEGWALVEYDSSAGGFEPALVTVTPDPDGPSPSAAPIEVPGNGPSEWGIPGPRYLYVVDPNGILYEAGNLGVASERRLLAWLPDRVHAIVSQPASGDAVTLHTFDLVSGQLSGPLPGPSGIAGGTWIDPEVRISTDGNGMVIESGAGEREIVRMGFDGAPVSVLVAPVKMGNYVQSVDGTILIVAEKETIPGEEDQRWTIVAYTDEASLASPSPSPTPEPTVSPTSSAEPGYGPLVRQAHGLPPGEDYCYPVSWPPDRQLLNACPRDDGTVLLYTLALRTSTFVDVATAQARSGDVFLAFNADGTRLARGRSMLNVLGEELWRINDRLPAPTGLAWAGEFILLWGDDSSPPAPGYGASEITARRAEDGELVYIVSAVEGASGFHAVIPALAAGG